MRTAAKLASTAAVLVAATVVAGGSGTYAAFSDTTANTGNSFGAGTIALTDDDAGAALFSAPAMKPGDVLESCLRVSYEGSLSAPVRLYGTSTGDLPPHLLLTVERGTKSSGSASACTGFTPDAGGGVLYDAALDDYPATWAAGIADPAGTWVSGDEHVYRLTVELPEDADDDAQGLGATSSFTWEAHS